MKFSTKVSAVVDMVSENSVDVHDSSGEQQVIKQFVNQHDWNEDAGFVARTLTNEISDEDKVYLFDVVGDMNAQSDRRSPKRYAQDLLLNWVIEDHLSEQFAKISELEVGLEGVDSNREFLSNLTSDPDFTFVLEKESYDIEMCSDYGGYWEENDKMELRRNKLPKLAEKGVFILAVDIQSQECFFINPQECSSKYIESHPPYGGKSAHQIDLEKTDFTRVDIDELSFEEVHLF
jgi:hypothetical protein